MTAMENLRRRARVAGNLAVIALTLLFVAVFAADRAFDLDVNDRCGLEPAELVRQLQVLRADPGSGGGWLAMTALWTPVVAHADFEHLGHNLLFFWLFGTLLAQVAGNRWVLISFFVTAATASIAYVVGSDGAVGAMLGAEGR